MNYLRRRKGPALPEETCKIWTWRKSIGDTFFQTTMTHVINFLKHEHFEGNTLCIVFPGVGGEVTGGQLAGEGVPLMVVP